MAIALLHPQRHDWCILLMECFVAYKGRIPHFYLYEVPEYIIISSPHLARVAPLLGGYHENYGSLVVCGGVPQRSKNIRLVLQLASFAGHSPYH